MGPHARAVAAALLFSCCALLSASAARAEGDGTAQRSCFGLLWCRAEENGYVSTDGLLYLYSSRYKRGYSRLALRPFFFRETDAERKYERRSVLWPLGDYERSGDDVSLHAFPLYWQARSAAGRYTVLAPFFFDYANGERSYHHLFPFYGHHARGDYWDRYFVLGPLFVSTRDRRERSERTDVLFPLFGRRRKKDAGATWLLPAYFSAYDSAEGSAARFVLPGYWSNRRPMYAQQGLFPLFGKEDLLDLKEHRFSALGLPPSQALDPWPTLALYEHRTEEGLVTDRFTPLYSYSSAAAGDKGLGILGVGNGWSLFWRFADKSSASGHLFPLYSYDRDAQTGERSLGVIGLGPASLYRRHATRDAVTDALFPLYRYSADASTGEKGLGMLGVGGGWSLFRRYADKSSASGHLFPLYSYDRDAQTGERSLGVIGLGPVSLYRRHATRDSLTDALFPLYRYSADASTGEAEWDALLVYQHRRTATRTKDTFLPLYHYSRDDAGRRRTFAALGLPPLGDFPAPAFYVHDRSEARTLDRLFPLYRYSAEPGARRRGLNVLLLYNSIADERESRDFLFPLYSRRHAGDDSELGVLGFGPLSLGYSHETSSTSLRQFLPFYFRWEDRLSHEEFSDALLLYVRQTTPDLRIGGLFPLYSYRESRDLRASYALGVLEFSLYRHLRGSNTAVDALLPLYGRRSDLAAGETRTTALGLPPWPGMPELSLYAHHSSSDAVVDRFSPVYDYRSARRRGESRISLLGLPHLEGSPTLSLYEHCLSTSARHDRLFPLYAWSVDTAKQETRLAILGTPPLSLYEHVRSSAGVSDRLFPLYTYGYDARTGESRAGALLYHRSEGPTGRSSVLFPFYSYALDKKERRVRVGVLGIAPVSLYQHLRSADAVDDRIRGLYHYHADRAKEEGEASFLWPLADYKTSGASKEFTVLWWLVDYSRAPEGESEFRVLGGSAMALFRRSSAPGHTRVEFNPIIPVYSHETKDDRLTEWGVLGFGRCTKDGRPRPKLFWLCT